jgi:EamA domain-containing membrane protein RarD
MRYDRLNAAPSTALVLGAATVIAKHVLTNIPLLNRGLALSFSLFGLTRTPTSISPLL